MTRPSVFAYWLSLWDYVILVAVIGLSMAIGFHQAWRVKKLKTVREFLVSNRGWFGVAPLVASKLATTLTPHQLLGSPSETYVNGLQMALLPVVYLFSELLILFTFVPVFYKLNLSTLNQYIELRFNRKLNLCQAVPNVLTKCLFEAAIAQMTAVILADATGLNYWWCMAIICGIYAVYTSMGGFSGVVYTDVLQVFVVVLTVVAIVVLGTNHIGGVAEVWKRNEAGNRTTIFRLSSNNETNYSIWSIAIGGIFVGLSTCTSQTSHQRMVSNSKLKSAKLTVVIARILESIIVISLCWVGMVTYARYHKCDPVSNKDVQSKDQIVALFAHEIFGGVAGLLGLFISGILSATLSTMSSTSNAFITRVIVDFVTPSFPTLSEKTMIHLSKFFGFIHLGIILSLALVIEKFGGLMQIYFFIVGASNGLLAGLIMLGVFFPWVKTTGAVIGFVSSTAFVWWICVGRLRYPGPSYSLPVTTEGCSAALNMSEALNVTKTHTILQPISSSSTDLLLSLYHINTMWYSLISILVCLTVGLSVSILLGNRDPEAVDPRYISPITWSVLRRLPVSWRKWLGFRTEMFLGSIPLATILEEKREIDHVTKDQMDVCTTMQMTTFKEPIEKDAICNNVRT